MLLNFVWIENMGAVNMMDILHLILLAEISSTRSEIKLVLAPYQ